jgi:hypothetical protein
MPFPPSRRASRLRRRPAPAAALARAALLESLEARRLLASVSWINPAGGDFNTPANWDTNTVPGPSDDAFITLDGDYTVSIAPAGNASVHSLTLGSATGVQTLSIDAATLTAAAGVSNNDVVQLTSTATLAVTGGTFVDASGATLTGGGGTLNLSNVTATVDGAVTDINLNATATTINGSATLTNAAGRTATLFGATVNAPLVNNGAVQVNDDSSIAGALTTGVGSTLAVTGNTTGGASTLTVSGGFTNNGLLPARLDRRHLRRHARAHERHAHQRRERQHQHRRRHRRRADAHHAARQPRLGHDWRTHHPRPRRRGSHQLRRDHRHRRQS